MTSSWFFLSTPHIYSFLSLSESCYGLSQWGMYIPTSHSQSLNDSCGIKDCQQILEGTCYVHLQVDGTMFTWHSGAVGPSIANDVFVKHRHFDAYRVVEVMLDSYRIESKLTWLHVIQSLWLGNCDHSHDSVVCQWFCHIKHWPNRQFCILLPHRAKPACKHRAIKTYGKHGSKAPHIIGFSKYVQIRVECDCIPRPSGWGYGPCECCSK